MDTYMGFGDYITCCTTPMRPMSACLCKHKQVISFIVSVRVYKECMMEHV